MKKFLHAYNDELQNNVFIWFKFTVKYTLCIIQVKAVMEKGIV